MATEPQEKTPEMALAEALVQFQKNCPMVPKSKKAGGPGRDGKPGKTYTFAPFDEVWGTIKDYLSAAGLAVHQTPEKEGNLWILRTEVLHVGGGKLSGIMPIIYSAGSAQDFGSAFSYARRYGLLGALCIATEDEDDDGTAASQKAQPPPQQATQPRQQAQGTKAPPQRQQAAQPPKQQAKSQPTQEEAKPEHVQAVQILYKNYLDELIHAGYKDAGTLSHRHFREFCNSNYGTSIKAADQLRSALKGSIPASILAMATPTRPYPWQPDEIVFAKDDLTILPDEENRPVGF